MRRLPDTVGRVAAAALLLVVGALLWFALVEMWADAAGRSVPHVYRLVPWQAA